MSDEKEGGSAQFQEYFKLVQDPAIKPFLQGLNLLFEDIKGHEEVIILLLKLVNPQTDIPLKKRDELAEILGLQPRKLQIYIGGIRDVHYGRNFDKQVPKKTIHKNEDQRW